MTTAGRSKRSGEDKPQGPTESVAESSADGNAEERDELAALRSDFERLREDVAALTEALQAMLQAGRRADEGSAPAGEGGGESGEASNADPSEDEWQELRDRFDQTRRHGREALGDLEVEVARHPLASLALAFGVGYLYARLSNLFR